MGPDAMNDHRRFTRVPFAASAHLSAENTAYDVELADISLNGALLRATGDWSPRLGENVRLELALADGVTIDMQCTVAHVEPDRAGLTCHHLDVDSATHLRRLIELNLGDESQLHRELSAMIAPP